MKFRKLNINFIDMKVGDIVINKNKSSWYKILKIKKHCKCHACKELKYIVVRFLNNEKEKFYFDEIIEGKREVLRFK